MKRLTCALLCLLLLLSACAPAAEVTPTPTPEVTPSPTPEITPSPTPEPSQEPSGILYINRELGFTMEMPLSWQDRVVIDDNCTTDTRNSGQYVTVYQKATYEQGLDGPDGALFSIGRYPGRWTEDEPPVYAGGCVLITETEDFTYFAITPSDVRWVESDAEIQADYADLVSQFSFVWSHISALDPSSALTPAQEPPLTAEELSMPVPDFLTAGQQALYRRARALYSRVRGGNTLAIDFPEELPNGTSYEEGIDLNGYHYVKSLGRYSRWADFEAVMLSVFTQEFWDSINTLPDGNQIYIDVDGSMYLIDFGMGSGLYYDPYIPDEYVLLEQSDTQVSFLLVGHYVFDALPREDETAEQYRDRLSQGWDYTLEFPIKLVLTENGWRFQEFHSTFCDEEGPSELSQEPPLTAEELSMPVPDFLTGDQQALYRRAYSLYVNAFSGYPRNLDAVGVTDPEARLDVLSSQPAVSIDGAPYLLSIGRYQNWEDLNRVVHSLFTDRFWKEINHSEPSSDGDLPRFVPREDGRLCFLDLDWFQDGSYNENFPDTFRLEEQTDTTVTFTLIGHYSDIYPRDGETPEDRDARLARQYDYTVEYPIKLVLTADGWRFDQFASASTDCEREGVQQTPHLNPAQEPPLTAEELSMPVPDFLTEEQQALYRRAYSAYLTLFGADTSSFEDTSFWPLAPWQVPISDYETFEVGGFTYQAATGRYRNWADFDAMVRSLFTDRFFREHNRSDTDTPTYRPWNGRTAFISAARGAGEYRNDYFPDTFELIEQTDDRVSFYLVGYYSYTYPRHDEPHDPELGYPDRDARLRAGYEYTEKFQIDLVLTDDGWRFGSFYNTRIDQSDYLGTLGD